MSIKFRLKGLAETFVEHFCCPTCGKASAVAGEESFETNLSKVTLEGIVVVVRCKSCSAIFLPECQRLGIINYMRLRDAVEDDSLVTGEPVYETRGEVRLEVERLNARAQEKIH